MQVGEEMVNALVLVKYTDGSWAKKNYFGFPVKAFFDIIDEMVSSDFTEYVVSVYYDSQGHFEKAVIEKGGWREFRSVDELNEWIKANGGKSHE